MIKSITLSSPQLTRWQRIRHLVTPTIGLTNAVTNLVGTPSGLATIIVRRNDLNFVRDANVNTLAGAKYLAERLYKHGARKIVFPHEPYDSSVDTADWPEFPAETKELRVALRSIIRRGTIRSITKKLEALGFQIVPAGDLDASGLSELGKTTKNEQTLRRILAHRNTTKEFLSETIKRFYHEEIDIEIAFVAVESYLKKDLNMEEIGNLSFSFEGFLKEMVYYYSSNRQVLINLARWAWDDNKGIVHQDVATTAFEKIKDSLSTEEFKKLLTTLSPIVFEDLIKLPNAPVDLVIDKLCNNADLDIARSDFYSVRRVRVELIVKLLKRFQEEERNEILELIKQKNSDLYPKVKAYFPPPLGDIFIPD